MHKSFILIFCTLVLCTETSHSLWNFAVTTKSKIIFYDETWSIVTTAAHQFDELSAITFDEAEERIFFNDQTHNNGSVFSLKIALENSGSDITEEIVSRVQNETIAGIAYDPLERHLYWTDAKNKKIYSLSMDSVEDNKPTVLFDFTKDECVPDGIAIDVCRRKLYWSNSNHKKPSIERSSLNGSKREIIVDSNLFLPHGIVVDQFSKRIYWVVDQEGSHFSIESSQLDGTDRQIIVNGLNNIPFNLVVTKNSIYWTDLTHNAVWNISKFRFADEQPTKVQNFPTQPKGIVARLDFLSKMENDVDCKDEVKQIKRKLLEPRPVKTLAEGKKQHQKREIFCLNRGDYNAVTGTCICKVGFTGVRCETNECHNFCVHGTCSTSSMGFPECTCQEGFFGERCETYKCTDYCLNNGHCDIVNGSPSCNCNNNFSGPRCENNGTEICAAFCKINKYEPDSYVPFGCYDFCDELSSLENPSSSSYLKIKKTQTPEMCSSTYNKTLIFAIAGVVTALSLIFIILKTLQKIYKPARPRIKKTFVVQKKISQTPLTSRPVATEQCEITIENCCNMNICDTPCFDPKLLQQNMSFESMKEDKKTLINNMEEDLY